MVVKVGANMKENIKVLEEFIEQYNTDEDLFCFINYSTIQAIENLIKRYKEQQEYIKELESKDYQERLDD